VPRHSGPERLVAVVPQSFHDLAPRWAVVPRPVDQHERWHGGVNGRHPRLYSVAYRLSPLRDCALPELCIRPSWWRFWKKARSSRIVSSCATAE